MGVSEVRLGHLGPIRDKLGSSRIRFGLIWSLPPLSLGSFGVWDECFASVCQSGGHSQNDPLQSLNVEHTGTSSVGSLDQARSEGIGLSVVGLLF